jgi:plastocyanin
MKDIGFSEAPQRHDILISAGEINRAHPEQSTLTLKLRTAALVPQVDNAELAQQEHSELKPGDEIEVKPGDIVTWFIEDPDISSILVMDDNKNKNVFESNPSPVFGSRSWSGVIDKAIRGNKVETYTICWSQHGITYCYDPKITVNP